MGPLFVILEQIFFIFLPFCGFQTTCCEGQCPAACEIGSKWQNAFPKSSMRVKPSPPLLHLRFIIAQSEGIFSAKLLNIIPNKGAFFGY